MLSMIETCDDSSAATTFSWSMTSCDETYPAVWKRDTRETSASERKAKENLLGSDKGDGPIPQRTLSKILGGELGERLSVELTLQLLQDASKLIRPEERWPEKDTVRE